MQKETERFRNLWPTCGSHGPLLGSSPPKMQAPLCLLGDAGSVLTPRFSLYYTATTVSFSFRSKAISKPWNVSNYVCCLWVLHDHWSIREEYLHFPGVFELQPECDPQSPTATAFLIQPRGFSECCCSFVLLKLWNFCLILRLWLKKSLVKIFQPDLIYYPL